MAEEKQNTTASATAIEPKNHGIERNHDPEWSELNELTLSVMSNRNRYDKYKKIVANTSDTATEIFNKEKSYYKPRILAMTRDLFDERCENEDINRAHEEYLKYCIDFLKWCDITEMVENDQRNEVREDVLVARHDLHKKIQETAVIDHSDTSPTVTTTATAPSPAIITAPAPPSTPRSRPNEETDLLDHNKLPSSKTVSDRILSFANKMCIRKKTMDDFIVMKPIKENSDEAIKSRLPKVRDYHQEILQRASSALDAEPAHIVDDDDEDDQ